MKITDTIIFDLDGTLLDTLEDLTDGVNYVLSMHAYPIKTIEEVRCRVGNGMRRLIKLCAPQGLEEYDIDNLFEELKLYYTTHSSIKTKPYPQISELLKYLKNEGYKTAIVSNKNHEAVCELKELYFKNLIDIAIGQQEGLKRKPYADAVHAALIHLGSTADRAVYVGDSEVDIKTAQNANMRCIAVSWGFRDKMQLVNAKAEYIADTAWEIIDIIKKVDDEISAAEETI